MSKRTFISTFLTLAAFVVMLLSSGVAHAKKSHFTVHNCTTKKIGVNVYDGDDTNRSQVRTRIRLPNQGDQKKVS